MSRPSSDNLHLSYNYLSLFNFIMHSDEILVRYNSKPCNFAHNLLKCMVVPVIVGKLVGGFNAIVIALWIMEKLRGDF